MSCYDCKAKYICSSAVQEGSVMCLINKIHSGVTHGDEEQKPQARYCSYCGQPLKITGSQKFCNNVRCINRFKNV